MKKYASIKNIVACTVVTLSSALGHASLASEALRFCSEPSSLAQIQNIYAEKDLDSLVFPIITHDSDFFLSMLKIQKDDFRSLPKAVWNRSNLEQVFYSLPPGGYRLVYAAQPQDIAGSVFNFECKYLIQNSSDLEKNQLDFWKLISSFHPQNWFSWSTEKRIEHSAHRVQALRNGSLRPLSRHNFYEQHFIKLPNGAIKEFRSTSFFLSRPIWTEISPNELREKGSTFKQFGTGITFHLVEVSEY